MNSLELLLHRSALRIESHNVKIIEWLRGAYHSCKEAGINHRYKLRFEELGSPEQLNLVFPEPAVPVGISTLYSPCFYGDGIFFSTGGTGNPHELYFDLNAAEMKINVGGFLLSSEETFIYAVARDILKKMIFPFSGFVVLHAAVVTKGQKTFCLLGDKGAGKSTLALQLMESGYRMLSDDSPLFALEGDKVYAWSSLDNLSMTKDTLDLFPRLKPLAQGRREVSGKYYIPRPNLDEELLCEKPVLATHLIDLRRQEIDKPQFKAYDKFALLQAIIEESMILFRAEKQGKMPPEFRQINQTMLNTIAQLVEQCQPYTLEYADRHLPELPRLLESL